MGMPYSQRFTSFLTYWFEGRRGTHVSYGILATVMFVFGVIALYFHGEAVGWPLVIERWFLYVLMFAGGASLVALFWSIQTFFDDIDETIKR